MFETEGRAALRSFLPEILHTWTSAHVCFLLFRGALGEIAHAFRECTDTENEHMKTKLLLAALPAALLTFSFACDNDSAAIDCESDVDCPAEQPTCDPTLLICIAEAEPQCTEDIECQVTDLGGSDACEANSDCADGEVCVDGSDATAHCILLAAGGCKGFGEATVDDVEGNSQTICVDEAVGCNADGECE